MASSLSLTDRGWQFDGESTVGLYAGGNGILRRWMNCHKGNPAVQCIEAIIADRGSERPCFFRMVQQETLDASEGFWRVGAQQRRHLSGAEGLHRPAHRSQLPFKRCIELFPGGKIGSRIL